jgi:7-cyano-7-deazaguanine synthase in queuosine biosynthesis
MNGEDTLAELHIPSVGSHVRFSGGKNSGTVTRLIMADDSDRVVSFIVHYGWRSQKAKMVPIENVKWVNADNVVLTLSRKQFDALDEWTGPAHVEGVVPEAAARRTTVVDRPSHD